MLSVRKFTKLSMDSLKGKSLHDTVTIRGWVKTCRGQKRIKFICLTDGRSEMQCVVDLADVTDTESVEALKVISTGYSIEVTGTIEISPGKEQGYEIRSTLVRLIGKPHDASTYPLAKKKLTLEHLREHAHLRCRTSTMSAIMKIRNTCAMATHEYFQKQGCIYLHTPIITGSDCEGAGEAFKVTVLGDKVWSEVEGNYKIPEVKFFSKPAYLTVSGQLHGEAFACGMSRIYTFGPTFRAENSHTSRHLAEFWMIEPEFAFSDLKDIMKQGEDYIRYCIQEVLKKNKEDVEFLSHSSQKGDQTLLEKLESTVEKKFVRLSYTQAFEELTEDGFKMNWGDDIGTEYEKHLANKYGTGVIVFRYPRSLKSFYMPDTVNKDQAFQSLVEDSYETEKDKRIVEDSEKESHSDPCINQDTRTVEAMDILLPGIGEIIGGSEREWDYDKLLLKIKEFGLNPESYKWYLDLRKYGSVPHAGFGLGFERLLLYVTGMSNIRDVIPFPRAPGTLEY